MAFEVQTDEGDNESANAYIDVEFFKEYHDDRGNEYEDDSDLIEKGIIKATDYIDNNFTFLSETVEDYQTTQFPRDKWEGIPLKIKQACAEYALRAMKSALAPDAVVDESNGLRVKSFTKKVGPIEKTVAYDESSFSSLRSYPAADALLREFTGGSFGSFSVYRA